MIGQAYSPTGRKYNIIILAGGAGGRMGNASDYIPKALCKLRSKRAIDYIVERYIGVAGKLIVGTGYHADLLESYLSGRYHNLGIDFSREDVADMKNNARSTTLCLDRADSRLGTIILFCDLIVLNNTCVPLNGIYLASHETSGNVGNFRHSINTNYWHGEDDIIIKHVEPQTVDAIPNGVLGMFVCDDTPFLKSVAYTQWSSARDLTEDILVPYWYSVDREDLAAQCVSTVYEFGNENDLRKVRELWEKAG